MPIFYRKQHRMCKNNREVHKFLLWNENLTKKQLHWTIWWKTTFLLNYYLPLILALIRVQCKRNICNFIRTVTAMYFSKFWVTFTMLRTTFKIHVLLLRGQGIYSCLMFGLRQAANSQACFLKRANEIRMSLCASVIS